MNWTLSEQESKYIFKYYLPADPTYTDAEFNQRGEALIEYCMANSIDTVMLCVDLDPNWYCMPDSLRHTSEYIGLIEPLIPKLRENGISYQLNYQNLFGSWDGGADLRYINGWECWVDEKGVQSKGCACSAGKRFREITGEKLTLWSKTKPDVIWISDDIRFHNHRTSVTDFWEGKTLCERQDYGCFCDEHIHMFNVKYNCRLSREEIRQGIINGGAIRRNWLEFSGLCADDVASWIENTIHAESPDTRVAVMTSIPDAHSVEGRNWGSFLSKVSGKHRPLLSPCFGPHKENSSVEFYNSYLLVEQQKANIKKQYGYGVDFCPEIENKHFSLWSKSIAATTFQLMMSSYLGCKGVTLSIFDLEGCILNEEPEFGKMLRDFRPFGDLMAKYDFWKWSSEGIALITSPDRIAQSTRIVSEIDDLSNGRSWDTALMRAGIPCQYITPDQIDSCKAVAVDEYTVYLLSDDEIMKLLSKGVILDAGAAQILQKRGFGEYLGVCVSDAMECIASSEVLDTMSRSDKSVVRVMSAIPGYKWYNLILTGASRVSTLLTPYGSEHVGFAKYKNTLGGCIYVYAASGNFGDAFFTNYRVKLLKEICAEISSGTIIQTSNTSYALTASKMSDTRRAVIIANMSSDVMENIEITVPEVVDKAVFVARDANAYPAEISNGKIICKNINLKLYDAIVCMIKVKNIIY